MVSTDTTTPDPADSPAWDETLLKNPHAVSDKRSRVQRMFAAIAPSYDLNNRLHSLWMDQLWRKKAVNLAQVKPDDTILDVACGTGDLTEQFYFEVSERDRKVVTPRPRQVVGLDFTFEMLQIARRKFTTITQTWSHQYSTEVNPNSSDVPYINGDAQSLPLPDEFCDVVSIAFGIRNVADPAIAIREFYRVLRPGGRLVILEFSLPTQPVLRGLYNFYFRKILPRTATLISGDKTGAYKYLPESVNTFIGRDQMTQMMHDAGFAEVKQFPMTFGVCVCYRGIKSKLT
ncbi:MAG TPA: bifunctional demethylmenaquinone methyltransferase/2-methoxy-6-polyprenyl-1,4-benzoquinol methylase UbiE [Tepidisphaeraceae bacterium]|jgi:demethylmenaquinone methyltransferase/2-methoxy-6-polyprenyl-1,4-benzoquinol methylase